MPKLDLTSSLRVRVDTPKGGFVKWEDNGAVGYISPLPCPFNYGSVPGSVGDDGDAWDAVVLGPRLARGALTTVRVWGVIDFMDDGVADPKLICGPEPPSQRQRRTVLAFFALYARLKGLAARARGRRGPTVSRGWMSVESWESAASSGTRQSP